MNSLLFKIEPWEDAAQMTKKERRAILGSNRNKINEHNGHMVH